MPLTRDQLNQIIEILIPHVNTSEDDRRTLIQRAFFGEPVVDQLTYSGQAQTFAINCVLHLKNRYNGDPAVVQLLETLRDYYVGVDVKAQIDALLTDMDGNSAVSTSTTIETTVTVEPPVLDAPLFISYSRKDFAFVNRLRDDLEAHGDPYWIDREGLSPGTPNWERAIRAAIETSSAVLWIVSPAAYESEYVSSELAVAEMYKRKIYPVWANGDNWIACVPLGKHNIQFVDMRGSSYRAGLEQLLSALRKPDSDLIVPTEETPEAPPELRNPYKGLMAFTEDDVQDFFGREALVTSLATRFNAQLAEDKARFLAVLGPSGAGKSSVVMAGLLPALKNRNVIPGSDDWRFLPTITPGAHPMESLAGAFAALTSSADPTTVLTKLYTLGIEYLNIVFDMLPAERIVLYIDQFEELFTLAKDDGERQVFISLLSGAATEPNGKLIVLLSMRADFLDYPLNYPQLGTLFDKYTTLVQPMSIPELRDAIQKPAQQSGLTFEDGLVADIVFALRGQDKALAGALPLLQFTLVRLYEERDGSKLTRDAYERIGGVSGAIGTHSEAVFTSLPEAAQDTLGQVFLPLVNIDEETGEPTRRSAPLADVVADPNAKMLVDAFVDNGLLQRGRDGSRRYLEVTHEALLRSWDTLVTWIAGTRDSLRVLRQFERDAIHWHGRGGDLDEQPRDEQMRLFYAALENLGLLRETLDDPLRSYAEPEQTRLLHELEDLPKDPKIHYRRREIGDRLAVIGDIRPGTGVSEGVPDLDWVPVSGITEKIDFEDQNGGVYGNFAVRHFFISRYQVTSRQFDAFINATDGFENPDWWQDMPDEFMQQSIKTERTRAGNNPRDSVSWYQCVAFSRWLDFHLRGQEFSSPITGSIIVGDGFEVRLPTEWEWQWACQNGEEKLRYPWGNVWESSLANTAEAGLGRAVAVGMYPHGVNKLGVCDLGGNLTDWCINDYEDVSNINVYNNEESKVIRGGSFYHPPSMATSLYRRRILPTNAFSNFGFRVVVGQVFFSLLTKGN